MTQECPWSVHLTCCRPQKREAGALWSVPPFVHPHNNYTWPGSNNVIIVGRAIVYVAVIKRWILLPSGSQFGQSRSKWEPKLQLCCVFLKWAPSSLVWERVYMLLEGTERVKNWILYRKRSWTLGIGALFWCGNSVIRLWVHPSCLAHLSCSSTSSTIPPRLNNAPTWGQYPILCWTWGHK